MYVDDMGKAHCYSTFSNDLQHWRYATRLQKPGKAIDSSGVIAQWGKYKFLRRKF